MQDDEQEQEETPSDNETTEFLNSSVNTPNISVNRSGHARIQCRGVDVAVQTEYVSDQPKLCISKRGCKNEIKSACARISSVCCVSIKTSRKAVQIVCKDLYNHNTYLSSNEQIIAEEVQPNHVATICMYFLQSGQLQITSNYRLRKWKSKLPMHCLIKTKIPRQ